MLGSEDSIWWHRLQNISLIVLSLAALPLSTYIVICSYILNFVLPSKVQKDRARARKQPSFKPQTVLVTGCGMTKGLVLARLFHQAGHNVLGADFEANGTRVCGRVSKSLEKFYPLSKPNSKQGAAPYIENLLQIITKEQVDLWVSCSGVASAVEDGEAMEIIERRTACKAIQFDVATTQSLHEKHTFIDHTRELGLTVPETHTIESRAQVEKALQNAPEGRRYIMKTIGMDDANRGDMTLLPKATSAETAAHLSQLSISKKSSWILQQFVSGREFCTHALVLRGHVKAFVACPSAELLMHYQALPAESKLSQAMLEWTRKFAAAGGPGFTGHLSFDFMVEDEQLSQLYNDPSTDVTLYPIECNPRAHTAVALFNDTPSMAEAYLSIRDDDDSPTSYAEAAANGTSHEPVVLPAHATTKYYWIGHDLVNILLLPLVRFITFRRNSSLSSVARGIDLLVDRLLFWKDGTFEVWDPLPWWWLYHVYWPWQFLLCLWTGRKWSRINVSTCKMFEC